MKKVIFRASMVLAVGLTAFACSNADTEKRIADLERRVKDLETVQTSASSTTSTPSQLTSLASTPAAVAPQPVAEVNEGPSALFNFSQTHHDFGNIVEGDVVKHVFTFTNNGEVPLIIERAAGSCGCTVPSYPKQPIPPGSTGEIQVEFNSKGRTGVQSKTVTITANTEPKVTKLTIRSNVSPAG